MINIERNIEIAKTRLENSSFNEIAEKFKISSSRAQQIFRQLMQKLVRFNKSIYVCERSPYSSEAYPHLYRRMSHSTYEQGIVFMDLTNQEILEHKAYWIKLLDAYRCYINHESVEFS